jgi:hypothetical protein
MVEKEVTSRTGSRLKSIARILLPIGTAAFISFDSVNLAVAKEKIVDKVAESCMSKCVFEETKPPPIGSDAQRLEVQRSRSEILRDCKRKCMPGEKKNKDTESQQNTENN